MARPSCLYPAETIHQVQVFILQHTKDKLCSKNKVEIGEVFGVDGEVVYQCAYRMGITLRRYHKNDQQDKQRWLDFASAHTNLTVTEIARKLNAKRSNVWYLLMEHGITVKGMDQAERKVKPVENATEYFQHDELFWTGYREN